MQSILWQNNFKSKEQKLALIAVCNKLIKQAYGIAKSGLDYDRNYGGRLS